MPPNNRYVLGIYITSIVLAMMLRIIPWPSPYSVLAPDWVLLTVIYWTLAIPDRYGVVVAWVIGLLTDVLTGRLLGQYALAYALITYLCIKQHRRLRHFPLYQQIVFILCILFLSQLLMFWIENLQHHTRFQASFWLPVISGTLVWPFLHALLNRICISRRISFFR